MAAHRSDPPPKRSSTHEPRGRRRSLARGQSLRWGGAVLCLVALASPFAGNVLGCNFIVDGDTTQCESDADCQDRGGSFANHVCSAEQVCVPIGTGGTGGGDPVIACTTSAECIAATDGLPAACIQGTCATLISEDCQEVVPESAIGDDSTVYLGFLGPLVGEFSSLGVPQKQAIELALDEIDQTANGVPGAEGGGRRTLAMIACHDLDDPLRAARHLVETARVPAIFGPSFSGITIDVSTDVTIPAGVLVVSASATSPVITDLADGGLVWRTAPSDKLQGIPMALMVSRTEARLRSDLNLSPSFQIKVASAAKGDAYGTGLANAIQPILVFNGKDVAENGSNYLPKIYDDPSDNPNFDFSELVAEIVAFEPNIVLPLGTNEGITKVMAAIEDNWPTTGTPPPRPYYVFPDGGRLDELLEIIDELEKTDPSAAESLRVRVRGTVPGVRGTNYQNFAIRFKQAYGKDPGTFAEHAYDAGYLVAYSMLASGETGVSGAGLAEGLTHMSSGASIVAGPNQINAAFNALTTNGSIDYDGASGPLDFDPATGEAPVDIDIWCVVTNQQTDTSSFISSGMIWDEATGDLVGSPVNCDELQIP